MYIVMLKIKKEHDIIQRVSRVSTLRRAQNIIKKLSKRKDVIILDSLIQEVRV